MNKKLPVGIQSFPDLIENNCVYVDKTKLLYKIITTGKPYFLSRPRRFGKSLTISTLDAIFRAKKQLFEGLWIYDSDYEWKEYPVVRIDMSEIKSPDVVTIESGIKLQLIEIAQEYSLEIDESLEAVSYFRKIFVELGLQGKKAVVLIDEYDKSLLSNITKDNVKEVRDFLSTFYGIIKSQDDNVKFILLTGVSKFSKVSVFSGLNNLEDITMVDEYSALCGYTQEELEQYFAPYIDDLAIDQKLPRQQLLEKIRYWYNGFKFSINGAKVYNPFSTLLLMKHLNFRKYWFETATPSFLIDVIRAKNFDIQQQDNYICSASDFSIFDVERLPIIALLYQTGYITISHYDKENDLYTLDFPNFEVKSSFLDSLLSLFSQIESGTKYRLVQMRDSLIDGDIARFFESLRVFFANIPYEIQLNNEKYYQSIFYAIMQLLGLDIEVESKTNRGRVDAVIKTKEYIYIFEFKLNGTKEDALEQIIDKEYTLKFTGDKRKKILVGAAFNQETRIIDDGDWVVKQL